MGKINIIDVNKSSNVVNRLFGDGESAEPIPSENEVSESSMTIYDIPLDQIKPRPVNQYMLSDIEELAGSIERTGQWQPIIVRINPDRGSDKKFVIVGGERRFSAMKLLYEKYKNSDEAKAQIFSTIKAHILSEEDEKNEEAIYADTNDFSRQLTNFERIIRLDPKRLTFETKEEKEYFVETVYGIEEVERYRNGDLKIKFNQQDVAKYIRTVLLKREPNLDISEKTIKNYLKFIEDSDDVLISATLKGIIPIRDARVLCKLPKEDQAYATMIVGQEDYYELLDSVTKKEKIIIPEEVIDKTPNEKYHSVIKTLLKSKSLFDEIQNSISDKGMNGNEKEVLKQVRSIIRAIEKLEELPQK